MITKHNSGQNSKGSCPYTTHLFYLIVMQPRLLPNLNKVQMSSLTCICTTQLSFCQKFTTSDMSRILTEGLNHYTVVFGLNCRRSKDSVVGYWSIQRKIMEDCFRDIWNIGAGYKRAKGYCRAKLNTPEASIITELNTLKDQNCATNLDNPTFKTTA